MCRPWLKLGHGSGQSLGENGIDFHGDDPAAGLEQPESQRAQARSHLENDVVRSDLRGPDDPSNRVCVVQEVLPQRLGRTDGEFLGKPANLGRPKQARTRPRHRRSQPRRPKIQRGQYQLLLWK